ncbi:MAG: hypothetical protein K6F09_07240 [Clostridiales bacterium]|nr:hypothetical protein [Clostridiales bacterium]
MTIIYLISKLLTYPAALLKAFWEHCLLKMLKVAVNDTRYMQKNEMCGHVEHELTETALKSFFYCFLQGIPNFLLSLPALFVSVSNIVFFGITPHDMTSGKVSAMFILSIVLYYVGISLWCNKSPLYEDALNMWELIYVEKKLSMPLRVLFFIPSVLIMAGSFLERYGISLFLYTAATAVLALIV